MIKYGRPLVHIIFSFLCVTLSLVVLFFAFFVHSFSPWQHIFITIGGVIYLVQQMVKGQNVCENERPVYHAACKDDHRP